MILKHKNEKEASHSGSAIHKSLEANIHFGNISTFTVTDCYVLGC